jgi:hypothetical protein
LVYCVKKNLANLAKPNTTMGKIFFPDIQIGPVATMKPKSHADDKKEDDGEDSKNQESKGRGCKDEEGP